MPPKKGTQRRRRPGADERPPAQASPPPGGHEAPEGDPKTGPRLLWLDPKTIIVPEHRIRSRYRGDERSSLVASVKSVNIQSPLGVKEVDGQWVLDDGENRLKIVIEENMGSVPCVVTSGTLRDVIKANVSTLNKGTPNPREVMMELAALNAQEGIEVWEIAEWSGKSEKWVEGMLTMEADLSPMVKQALGELVIALGHAELLVRLETHAEQEAALARVLQHGWRVAELEEHLSGDPGGAQGATPSEGRAPQPRNPRVCTVCHTEQQHGTIQTMHVCDTCAGKMREAPAPDPEASGLVAAIREALPELREAEQALAQEPGSVHLAERIGALAELLEGGHP